MKKTPVVRLVLLVVLAAAGAVAAWFFRDRLGPVFAWVSGLGVWGLIVLAAAYLPSALFAFPPAILFTIAAGGFYDVIPATVAISLGSTRRRHGRLPSGPHSRPRLGRSPRGRATHFPGARCGRRRGRFQDRSAYPFVAAAAVHPAQLRFRPDQSETPRLRPGVLDRHVAGHVALHLHRLDAGQRPLRRPAASRRIRAGQGR